MPATYIPIASTTLSSNAASVTFSSIPGTYTDLVLRCTFRGSDASLGAEAFLRFNGSSATNYSYTILENSGGTVQSTRSTGNTFIEAIIMDTAANTTNTFTSMEVYIPNYTASANKPASISLAREQNATTDYTVRAEATLWRDTSALNTILLSCQFSNQFVSGSTFHLYGIKKD